MIQHIVNEILLQRRLYGFNRVSLEKQKNLCNIIRNVIHLYNNDNKKNNIHELQIKVDYKMLPFCYNFFELFHTIRSYQLVSYCQLLQIWLSLSISLFFFSFFFEQNLTEIHYSDNFSLLVLTIVILVIIAAIVRIKLKY